MKILELEDSELRALHIAEQKFRVEEAKNRSEEAKNRTRTSRAKAEREEKANRLKSSSDTEVSSSGNESPGLHVEVKGRLEGARQKRYHALFNIQLGRLHISKDALDLSNARFRDYYFAAKVSSTSQEFLDKYKTFNSSHFDSE